MKTNNLILSILSFFLFSLLPLNTYAEKIENINYYKNNPQLGGDITITKATTEVIGDNTYKTFEVIAHTAGYYYINFWMLPTQKADKSFTSYNVLVNNSTIGRITPTKGNWQSIGLEDNQTVYLKKGDNLISVSTKVPEIAEVEFVRLAPTADKAVISSEAYDLFLKEAKEGVITPTMEEMEVVDAEISSADVGVLCIYSNCPVRYSWHSSHYFYAGQLVTISSSSSTGHVLDFFMVGTGTDVNLNWRNDSEKANNSSTQLANIIVTIPQSGTYMIKARSKTHGTNGVVTVNVNGSSYYSNVPINYQAVRQQMPAQSWYTLYTCSDQNSNYSDPFIFVEGDVSGKIIAYNNDVSFRDMVNYKLTPNDSFLQVYPLTPITNIHTISYSSSDPVGSCNIYMNRGLFGFFSAEKGNDNLFLPEENKEKEISNLGIDIFEATIYPNPAERSSSLTIRASETITKVEVYDISGQLVTSRKVDSSAFELPLSELNIGKAGIYLVKVSGDSGTVTRNIIVN